ncbi:thiamine pathway transporter THI73-like protein [Babesia ovata]|uniref:Thiamine pathway transporter THI73-like protein n=1 Tax=Babesia ovata TaxID=189622 RepID=A0A2H6K8L0_9APIC|nr:thiamine pathway transporter THI73-like protein [Babesia ovata]GBE59289.1 thiamine pathway transporter THI73-like protein [Babesia ovata]
MPRAPPGIRQREVYSELLVSTGLLFEKRHKARQLADLAQLHIQAKCYLDRWVSSEQVNREVEVALEGEGEQSPEIFDTPGDDLHAEGPVIRSVSSNAAYDAEYNWGDHHRTGTKVYLATSSSVNEEGPECGEQSDVGDADDIDNPAQSATTVLVDNIGRVDPVAKTTSGDAVVNILGEDETPAGALEETGDAKKIKRYPNLTVAKIIWTSCFLTQLIVSAAIVITLYLSNRFGWNEKFRSLHIVYPFAAYFSTRVIAQGAIDWTLTRYVRSYQTVAKTYTRQELYRVINGTINNTCLVLAVAAASLPNTVSEDSITYATVTSPYIGIIAAILSINVVATLYQCFSKYRLLRDLSA